MSDPLQRAGIKPRSAPGTSIAEALLTPPKKSTPESREEAKQFLQLGAYANKQIAEAGKEVERFVESYAYPSPPGSGPPGAGAPQKKLIEDVGGLILPKTFFKALTEIGEGQVPFVKRTNGIGLGLGVGEEDAIYQRDQRIRAEREAYFGSLLTAYYQGRGAAENVGAAIGLIPPPNPPGRPLDSPSVSNLVEAAHALARGPARDLHSERGDP